MKSNRATDYSPLSKVEPIDTYPNNKGARHLDLIRSFLYFSIFKHPLTREEAMNFCQYPTDSVDKALETLLDEKMLYKIDDYYLPYNYPLWVQRRKNGNQMAQMKMGKARKMANVLNYFPFVRSVMVSGSLSKGFMDDKSDIDFFVIMKPGNIAISKFLMGIFRRFFAPRSFCINFIIDADHLYIKKQNLYTAIEMVTLIPMIDADIYPMFMQVNMEWIRKYLPNAQLLEPELTPFKRKGLQKFLEFICTSWPAGKIDVMLRSQYKKRLLKTAAARSHATGEVVITKGIIKLHNKPYQEKIMNLYSKYQKDFYMERELVFNEHFYD